RTALDPSGQWIPAVLAAADQRLEQVRRSVPDAGGLVIATDRANARAYARHLRDISGEDPTVVLSDDGFASDKIEDFAANTRRWMVAVRMVSEGVDIPRLAVGVYATTTTTPLFFAQAIGRFVRARRRGETASIFLPSIPPLLRLAASLEAERDHVLNRPRGQEEDFVLDEWLQAQRPETASADLESIPFQALGAEATFDRVLFDGGEFGTNAEVGSIEEREYLGIPGLLEPEQVSQLLRQRQAEQLAQQQAAAKARKRREQNAGISAHRKRAQARKELAALVAAWAARSGTPHGVVHTQLRQRCGGPEVARASTAQIQARITQVRRWFVGKD
ncbi:MAG: ATP-dependent helicase, partial [Bowdeniella nasicola]|nr:ATP-dependent helicase [Bowdeniella nasicola]